MASQITSIIAAVAGLSIAGYAMPVCYGATEKDLAEIADLPMRNISCYASATGSDIVTTGVGRVMTAQWIIEDTAYIQKVGMGLGKSQVAPTMYGYAGAYINALRSLSTSNRWSLDTYRVVPSSIEWPQASSDYMHAVTCTLTITEIVQ